MNPNTIENRTIDTSHSHSTCCTWSFHRKIIRPLYLWVKFILSIITYGQNASQQKFRIFEGYGSFINSTRFICDELHKCIHSCTRCFSLMATKDAVSLMFWNNSAQCNNTSVRTNYSAQQSLSAAGPKTLKYQRHKHHRDPSTDQFRQCSAADLLAPVLSSLEPNKLYTH